MAKIIDEGIAKSDSHFILVYGGVLILLAAVGLLSSITAQYFAAKAAVGFATNLRHGLLNILSHFHLRRWIRSVSQLLLQE